MDAVVFERDVDGKKQVMVSFRGTEGDKIIEKNSLGIPMKPGEGMKDLKTDTNHFVKKKFICENILRKKGHLSIYILISFIDVPTVFNSLYVSRLYLRNVKKALIDTIYECF